MGRTDWVRQSCTVARGRCALRSRGLSQRRARPEERPGLIFSGTRRHSPLLLGQTEAQARAPGQVLGLELGLGLGLASPNPNPDPNPSQLLAAHCSPIPGYLLLLLLLLLLLVLLLLLLLL